jgi:hypothetical protein
LNAFNLKLTHKENEFMKDNEEKLKNNNEHLEYIRAKELLTAYYPYGPELFTELATGNLKVFFDNFGY